MADITNFKIYSGMLKAYEVDGRKRLKTTASSTIKDLAGDEFSPKAINEMAESASGRMTIFLNHSYDVPEDVLGTVDTVAVQNRNEYVDLDFDILVNEANPRAVQTWMAVDGGVKLGTSIGAQIPKGSATRKDDGGYLFDSAVLLEASVVGIPANPRSWVQYAMKALDMGNDSVTFGNTTTVLTNGTSVSDNILWKTVEAEPEEPETPDTETEPTNEPAEEVLPEETKDLPAQDADDSTPEDATETVLEESMEVPAGDELPGEDEEVEGMMAQAASTISIPSHDFATIVDLLKTTTSELVIAKTALIDEVEAHAKTKETLRKSREQQKDMEKAIDKISSLPVGRRARIDSEVENFRTRFGGTFDEQFLQLLESKPHE